MSRIPLEDLKEQAAKEKQRIFHHLKQIYRAPVEPTEEAVQLHRKYIRGAKARLARVESLLAKRKAKGQ